MNVIIENILRLENEIHIEFKKLQSDKPDKPMLYDLADHSRIYKEWACAELWYGDKRYGWEVTNDDLVKIVRRSFKYKERAAERLLSGNPTKEQLEAVKEWGATIEQKNKAKELWEKM